jgi:hypothetical protein
MMDDNDSVILDISGSSTKTKPKKYFCNHCNRSLFLTDKDTQEYICTNCTITYYPNNQLVKKANKFDIPEGSDPSLDKTPPIVMIDEPNKELSSTSYKQTKLSPSFEALKKSGFNFTSYEER